MPGISAARKSWPETSAATTNIGTPMSTVTNAPAEAEALATPRLTMTLLRLKEAVAMRANRTPSI